MNRERLLFVGVLAIVALWFFVMREKPQVTTDVRPPAIKLNPLSVADAAGARQSVTTPDPGAFTLVTNERPHARPLLVLPEAARRDLPDVWPATSRSVSPERYGWLRRPGAAPQEGAAQVQLPEMQAAAGGGNGGGTTSTVDRIDTWMSFGRTKNKGTTLEIVANGKKLRPPRNLPPVGAKDPFYYFLCLLEIDPDRAQAEGVTQIQAKLDLGGTVRQAFPKEISEVQVCVGGRHKAYLDGMKVWLKLPPKGFQARINAGKRLLQDGRNRGNSRPLFEWALFVLEEGKQQLEASGGAVATNLRDILLLMLDAANRLNRQELVLNLAFEHLAKFPRQEEVLVYVGNILASRSYDLQVLAERLFAMAANSSYAQRRRVEVLATLGRYDDARTLLASGRAGGGGTVDLLQARVALALGDLDSAGTRARNHTSGRDAAEAYQILGAVAYVQGDAAKAEEYFLNAVTAEPGRSTAYSDLGLALAVQGKAADANACFDRAFQLDQINNPVTPRLGKAYLKLTAKDFAGAAADLTQLQEDNPNDRLVRYYLGYAKEQGGDLGEAARIYRSILDDDHRYRMVIARLGRVQSQRVEAGADAGLLKEADAHLTKAVALNPKDASLPYILARFLMAQDVNAPKAARMFARAEVLQAAGDEKLPLWAKVARACLEYRDDGIEERRVKANLNAALNDIKDQHPPATLEKDLMKDPVYAFVRDCLDIVQENETKVDKTWSFAVKPRDWTFNVKDPMRIRASKGARFFGEVDYGGQLNDQNRFTMPLEHCSIEYTDTRELNGNSFYELIVEGTIPENCLVDFGVGLVNKGRGRRGPQGVQIRRKSRTGNAEIRLEGGEIDEIKQVKARQWIELTSVPWPAGKFRVHFKIVRGRERRQQGRFDLTLKTGDLDAPGPGVNVFQQQYNVATERCSIFGAGRANRPITVYCWVEGTDGNEIPDIYVNKVVLTKTARKK